MLAYLSVCHGGGGGGAVTHDTLLKVKINPWLCASFAFSLSALLPLCCFTPLPSIFFPGYMLQLLVISADRGEAIYLSCSCYKVPKNKNRAIYRCRQR